MINITDFDFNQNASEFIDLFNLVFKRKIDLNYLKWKFLDTPFGRGFGFGAWDKSKLVGFVGVWPLKLWAEDKEVSACAGGDTMVDPAYRGKGIFTQLTQRLLHKIDETDLIFRYSVPGKMSYPGYIKKLNHKLVCFLPYYIKVHPLTWLKSKIVSPQDLTQLSNFRYNYKNLTLKVTHTIDSRYDQLWNETRQRVKLGIIHNSSYLDWRFIRNPEKDYLILCCEENTKLVGFAVIRQANLVEIWAQENINAYTAMLRAADQVWKRLNHPITHSWTMGDSIAVKALKNNLWFNYNIQKRPFGLYQDQPLICYNNPSIPDSETFMMQKKWLFSMTNIDFM